MPEACLSPDKFPSCAANESYVTLQRPTTISAAGPDITWNVANQRRKVLLQHNVTLQNIRIDGLATDAIPYIWCVAPAYNSSFQ
jgi:hypothetical protein